MKRLLQYVLFFIFSIVGLITSVIAQTVDVYVAPNGNDADSGTLHRPKASLAAALRQVREIRRLNGAALTQPIHIIFRPGTYYLQEPVFIRPEDSGTPHSPTIIQTDGSGEVVISGGAIVSGWKKLEYPVQGLSKSAMPHVWVADLPDALYGLPPVRQLWVNGKKAVRARWPNGMEMQRILTWDKKDETCLIPAPPSSFTEVKGAEMFIHQWWEIAILRINNMQRLGDSARLSFRQPESRIQSEHPWPAPWLSKETGNSAFYLSNAISFLDEPGEWFADHSSGKLYYWPREGEDLGQAMVVVPVQEQLIKISGTADAVVQHIYFKGIHFKYAAWNRPSLMGHVPHQAGMPMTDAYKLRPAGTREKASLENQAWIVRPAAAIEVSFAHDISFETCTVQHVASTGLDFIQGVKHSSIKGSLFKDIGGTAILAGMFAEGGMEIHLPYNPQDERIFTDSIVIANNLITDATNEDWGAVGIGLGYVRNTTVIHNEIENVNYSGISLGWGWSPQPNVMKDNRIIANRIHHFGKQNYDCAGIYTLSAQPGTLISENYIDSVFKAPYAHLPSHWFYLYTDEGSAYITIKNNWTPSHKYLQNNNGPGNQWQHNGPEVDARVKQLAGLEPQYHYLLKEKTAHTVNQPINKEHEELVEIIVDRKSKLDEDRLKAFLKQNNVNPNSIYRWKNRYVIFDRIQDLSVFEGKLKKEFPQLTVRAYYHLYYHFDRSNCSEEVFSDKEKEHIILTANLVEDADKQQEYFHYHDVQFDEWPEVAKGFCNAQFEQLLCFTRDRQLMLVISIPKGKNLNELNPKTIENNPRVVEWNQIMAQYQESIEGAKDKEVWKFFKKLNK